MTTTTSSINIEGLFLYVKDGLSYTKDGKWFDFGLKLLENIYESDKKTKLVKEINKNRLERGWNLI